ncbi:MAG: N-acetylglucosamine-6-phosphate deacetylase [Propionibacteriaceae bacterium]
MSQEQVRGIAAGQVVTSNEVLTDCRVLVTDGRISGFERLSGADAGAAGWLLPGYVDTHVHAGGGADFSTTDTDEARRVIDFHRGNGSTSMIASLVTNPIPVLESQIRTLAPLVDSGDLAGIHLEGPFLAAARCGAHDPDLLIPPTDEVVDTLLAAADGRIAMVTVAPELPHAIAAVGRFVEAGVRVAIGHTDADRDTIAAAIDAGATVATHLFNGMPPVHHRTPGPVPLLLADERVQVELIADGTHLHPDTIAMAIRASGPDRVALITDAMAAAGMADGRYRVGALDVEVRAGVARLVRDDGEPGSIAGSTLTMAEAVRFVYGTTGTDLPTVARMAATAPADWHRITGAGRIEIGAPADLVLVDSEAALQQVWKAGAVVSTGSWGPTGGSPAGGSGGTA